MEIDQPTLSCSPPLLFPSPFPLSPEPAHQHLVLPPSLPSPPSAPPLSPEPAHQHFVLDTANGVGQRQQSIQGVAQGVSHLVEGAAQPHTRTRVEGLQVKGAVVQGSLGGGRRGEGLVGQRRRDGGASGRFELSEQGGEGRAKRGARGGRREGKAEDNMNGGEEGRGQHGRKGGRLKPSKLSLQQCGGWAE